jgi:DHA2 family methylenomycin A resistance protein-like MFS transporter
VRLAVLVVAQVLSVANASMIAVALPPLARDLGASGTQQQWIVDAFVLVFASLLIAGGVLGDRLGRRRALVGGLCLFAAGSLACALAPNPGILIATRVLQGLGPPLLLPASLAIVTASSPDPQARARAIGIWGSGSGVGVATGPLLGGLVVSTLGWRWVFAFNVPVALALAGTALAVIPADRGHRSGHRFDRAGALLVTLGLAGIVFGIIEGRERGWTSAAVLAGFAAGAVLLAAFVRTERRHPDPLVDLSLLGRGPFAAANLGGGALLFVSLGVSVYLSAHLQAEGRSALSTGLALLPLGAMVAAFAAVSGRATAHVAPRTQMLAGLAAACAGCAALAPVPDALWPGLVLLGAGIGIALPAMTATAVSAAPGHRTGMASAIHNASRQIGATFGVAVLGTITLGAGLHAAMITAAALLAAVAAATVWLID